MKDLGSETKPSGQACPDVDLKIDLQYKKLRNELKGQRELECVSQIYKFGNRGLIYKTWKRIRRKQLL